MGTITRGFANNITTGGILLPGAVNNSSFDNVTSAPAGSVPSGGALNLIQRQTGSNVSSINFTSLGSYDTLWIIVEDYDNVTDGADLEFQVSTNGGSSYGIAVTTTNWRNVARDSGTSDQQTSRDNHNDTNYVEIIHDTGNDAVDASSAEIWMWNVTSTTKSKNFFSQSNTRQDDDDRYGSYQNGYFNTTSAVNAISFKAGSGNMTGTIAIYGMDIA